MSSPHAQMDLFQVDMLPPLKPVNRIEGQSLEEQFAAFQQRENARWKQLIEARKNAPAAQAPAAPSPRPSATQASHAHSVPTVPGALGDRPEPKPSAMACAGCASMKRTVGHCGAGGRTG